MNANLATILACVLVVAALTAELYLMRVFVGDWLEHRRERRPARMKRESRVRTTQTWSRSNSVLPWAAAAMGLACITPGLAHGQEADQPVADAPLPAEPVEPGSAFSFQFNLDFTTAYFYHGIIQEDSGLIVQPAAKMTINLINEGDFKLDAIVGVWNSFHGQKTAAQTHGDFSEYWYEADLIGGFAITKDKLSLTAAYVFLTSPSDAYETVQEIDFTLAYDDSELLGKFALHPYVLLGVEVGADASDGAHSDSGTYLELGIAPGFTFDLGRTPVAMSFPASIGLSLNNYYQNAEGDDETFGFAQIGVKASLPLPFGDRYGAWTLNAGVSGMYLGDNTADYNGGDHEQVIGTIGLQVNF